jgi:hypothetical protein
MTNREKIWIRAKQRVAGWQGGKSIPTPGMAYIAGWQAAKALHQAAMVIENLEIENARLREGIKVLDSQSSGEDCQTMCNALQRIEAGEHEPRMIARRALETRASASGGVES